MCESSNITSTVQNNVYDPYPDFLDSLKNRVQSITCKTVNESVPLYTTNAEYVHCPIFLQHHNN